MSLTRVDSLGFRVSKAANHPNESTALVLQKHGLRPHVGICQTCRRSYVEWHRCTLCHVTAGLV